jgi:LPXTG-motif cell wall-anchored protein
MVEEEELDGYNPNYLDENEVELAGENISIRVVNIPIADEPTGSLKVIKYIDEFKGEPHAEVEFHLSPTVPPARLSGVQDDTETWPRIEVTDDDGQLVFNNLEPGYYILEEIVPAGYETDLDSDEPIYVGENEETEVVVINTYIGNGDDDDDDDDDDNGGGSSSRRRRRTTTETIEVPEEPEVFTPAVEEPRDEPVVVEEPLVTAPVLPDLPHTGGNPAAFVVLGAALAGLGLYVRKRR